MSDAIVHRMSRGMVIQRLKLFSDETIVSHDAEMVFENAIAYLEEDRDAKQIVIRDILVDMIHDSAPDEAIAWMVKYSRKVIDDLKRKENK